MAKLSDWLDRLEEEALRRWPQVDRKRLAKARRLALGGKVSLSAQKGEAKVRSETGSQTYTVSGGVCNCEDSIHRPGVICAHRMAAWMLSEALKRSAFAVMPETVRERIARNVEELGYPPEE